MDRDVLLEAVKRAPALDALDEEPMAPRDLTDRLDVSRSTAHRIARRLEAENLVERDDGELALTAFGDAVADEVRSFRRSVRTARRLEPVLAAFRGLDVDFPAEAFADATVTEPTPEDPYRPVNRFMELVADTETLRGVDPAAINPLHLDDLHRAVVDGMETDAVFRSDVVTELVENNPERARSAFESGNLTLRTHDELPFGLTLCDDRVGVGVYDEDTGMLEVYVDTDSAAAREWGEDVYASFLAEADVVDWRARLGDD